MGQRITGQYSHRHGNGYPVVATQCGTLGRDIVSFYGKAQAILLKIQLTTRLFLADHVQMTLNNQRFYGFIARCRFFYDDHISQIILMHFQTLCLCKGHAVVTQFFLLVGRMRNLAYLLKVLKYFRRLQI